MFRKIIRIIVDVFKLLVYFGYLFPKTKREKAKGIRVFKQELLAFGMDQTAIDTLGKDYEDLGELGNWFGKEKRGHFPS